jgi:hypothetical protein
MKNRILIFAALLFGAFAATQALAGDVRFPQTGYPAISFQIPDDWTANPDGDGNLIVAAGDHSIAIALSLVAYNGTTDDMAAGAMKAAGAAEPRRGEATTMSGYPGVIYYSAMSNGSGVHVNMKMIVVQVGSDHAATCTLLYIDSVSDASMTLANTVIGSMSVSTEGP